MATYTHLSGLGLDTANTDQPTVNGQIVYKSGTGFRFYQEGTAYTFQTSSAGATAYDDIGNPDGTGSIAMGAYTGTYTSATVNWGGLIIQNTHANPTAGANLLTLNYTADADAHAIFFDCQDATNVSQFKISADGATVITGNATGTDALTLTAGDITLTDGDLTLTTGTVTLTAGGLDVDSDNVNITLGDSGATDSKIYFDGAGNLTFFDSTVGAVTLSQLEAASPTGDFTIADGQFSWTDATAEQAGTWTFAGTSTTDIAWASSVTSGKCLSITADPLTTGDMLYLDTTHATVTSGKYIHCYDGAASDFTVAKYGATVIAGTAATTDALTITAGTFQMTDGNIDMDEGKIEIDSTSDEISYIKRDNATGTGPVFEIEETNAAGGVTLLVDSDHTGAADAMQITYDGTDSGLNITSTNVASTGLTIVGPASQTAQGVLIESAFIGTADLGMVDIASSGVLVAGANLLRIDSSGANEAASFAVEIITSGAIVNSTEGAALRIDHTGTAGAGTVYAMYLNATADAALHIAAGAVQIDSSVTIGAGAGAGANLIAHGTTSGQFVQWDEANDLLFVTKNFRIGGTQAASDGVTMDFDGANLDIDAVTANDNINFGSDVDTNVIFTTAGGAAMTIDHGANSITVSATTQLLVAGNATTGAGLSIPGHASNTPNGTVARSIFFEDDAKKLWIYNPTSASWEGTVLA